MPEHILWFHEISMRNLDEVGGKNASLGEMINHLSHLGIRVPKGFATTAEAFRNFLSSNGLTEKIHERLEKLDINDLNALTETGKNIRGWIMDADFSQTFIREVTQAYEQLEKEVGGEISVAVRSSATAEDLPEASFAGQQETYLNISGIEAVLQTIKAVFASLYNDRAITYRAHHGFSHAEVALSAGIQRMVRSDKAASGVIFSMDTESGFRDAVFVTAAYGLGEPVVQGQVNPDEFYVFKPALQQQKSAILQRNLGSKAVRMVYDTDSKAVNPVHIEAVPSTEQLKFCISAAEVEELARYALIIEQHYGKPMDIEWAKDGLDGKLYILQARPETVKSRQSQQVLERYTLKTSGEVLTKGRSIGQKIGKGRAKILKGVNDMLQFREGDILVTDMTDPDWEPIMKKAAAIVTNRGGRTCHAAIIARELGIPAVVGCGDATTSIQEGRPVTVSCAEGDTGYVYSGLLDFAVNQVSLEKMPELPVKIMLNVGNPERAFAFQSLPNHGVGLARLEFIINHMIGIHPKALLNFENLDAALKESMQAYFSAYGSPREYYVERLKEGIASIAAAFYPKPVIVRLSDFKTNEYAHLLGGQAYEPQEENPMLGFRGASRYINPAFRDCFVLECEALKRAREDMGLKNIEIMVPFVRTLKEAGQVIELLAANGLKRGENDLRLIMMCEIPANALLAEQFLEYFDGFSIGSNDLTQLTLGLDRDSGIVAELFDERDAAVKILLRKAIQACHKAGKYIGICGQGPSDHLDLAQWLIEQGINSLSLNPDSVIDTWLYLAQEVQEKS